MKTLVLGLALAAIVALAANSAIAYNLPKSPGQYCKAAGFSQKKTTKGKGKTPFAQCVSSVKKVNRNNNIAPSAACKGLAKKHVKGMKRTPFAACLSAVKSAKNDLAG